ncbi:MAG: hypothetical protein U0Q18_15165 [Bryobacteraceae bacterium]
MESRILRSAVPFLFSFVSGWVAQGTAYAQPQQSITTVADVDAGGNVNAVGTVSAGTSSTTPGCVHLQDGASHDMGICAPASGFSGLLTLPVSAGTLGAFITADITGTALTWTRTIRGVSPAPAAVCGAGAGTGCNISVTSSSTNNAGRITVFPGTGPTSEATIATITFNATILPPGGCLIGPANSATSGLVAMASPFVSSVTATNFVITSGTAALSGGPYSWWYVCV